MVKKAKKQVKDIAEVSLLAGGSSIAIGALGGTQPFGGMSGMMPAMGTMVGAGMMMRTLDHSFGSKKKTKRRK